MGQISDIFGQQTANNENFQKILFEPSSGTKMTPKGTKMTPKVRGATKMCR